MHFSNWRRAKWLAAIAAVVCYLNVLPNDFCDDGVPIVQHNHKVTQPGGWRLIWTTDYWSDAEDATPRRDLLYRPIALSSYRIMHGIFGANPLPHHVLNILLHACISALVVGVVRLIRGTPLAGAVAGIVFATLPIHSGVINNVVGRADLLATAGVLAALLAHRRAMTAISATRRLSWYGLAVCCIFVAIGAKESGVAAVAIIVCFDLYWSSRGNGTQSLLGPNPERSSEVVPPSLARRGRGRFLSDRMTPLDPPLERGEESQPALLETALLRRLTTTAVRVAYVVSPVAVYLLLRWHALGGHLIQKPVISKSINVLVDAPAWQHALGLFQLWGMYWAKTVWPQVLCVNYSINAVRLATSLWDPAVLAGIAITAVLIIASIIGWRRGTKSIALITIALVIAHAPTSNAVSLIQVFFAERLWYAPSVWVCILVGLALGRAMTQRRWQTIGVLIVVLLIARCWVRSAEWRDNGTLYAATYRDHPNSIGGCYLYGRWLADAADDAETVRRGIDLLQRATEIDPGSVDSQRVLGHAHLKIGNIESAVRHLQIADMQIPGHPPTQWLLQQSRQRLMDDRAEELAALRARADSADDDVDAHLALVRRLRDTGDADQALTHLRTHDDKFTQHPRWQCEFAVTLVMINDRDAAIARYRRCVESDANNPQAILEMVMLLLERREGRDLSEAWTLVDRADEIAPHAPKVLMCRAELVALKGDMRRAVDLYDEAIRQLRKGSTERRLMEQRAATLGRRD